MSSFEGGPVMDVRHPDDCPPDLSVAAVAPGDVHVITDMKYHCAVAPAAIGPRHRAETGTKGWRRAVAGVLVAAGLLGSLKGDGNDFEPAPAMPTAAELAAQLPSPRGANGGLEAETAPERIAAYQANVQAAYESHKAESPFKELPLGQVRRVFMPASGDRQLIDYNVFTTDGIIASQGAGGVTVKVVPPDNENAYMPTYRDVAVGVHWPEEPQDNPDFIVGEPADTPYEVIKGRLLAAAHSVKGTSRFSQLTNPNLVHQGDLYAFVTDAGIVIYAVDGQVTDSKEIGIGTSPLTEPGNTNESALVTCLALSEQGGASVEYSVTVGTAVAAFPFGAELPEQYDAFRSLTQQQ